MNKHCKGETNETGICPTCGDIMNGYDNRCPMEIYYEATNWKKSLLRVFDAALIIGLAAVAVHGFGKAFGAW